jgi:hypothetical protein
MARAKIGEMFRLFQFPWSIGIVIGVLGGITGIVTAIIAAVGAAMAAGLPVWAVVLIGIGCTLFGLLILSIFYFAFGAVLGPEASRSKVMQGGELAEAFALPSPSISRGKLSYVGFKG